MQGECFAVAGAAFAARSGSAPCHTLVARSAFVIGRDQNETKKG
jgi:hypothetical protein